MFNLYHKTLLDSTLKICDIRRSTNFMSKTMTMRPSAISVSRKGTWDECQQRYKYRYYLKVESPEEEPYYFQFGKIVHKIAEEYVQQKGTISINEITKSVIHGEIELEEGVRVTAPLPAAYAKRLPNHVRTIKSISDQMGFEGETEFDFKLDMQPPHEKFVVGFIDRLIIKNGIYFIVDYKTTKKGRWRKTPITIKKDLQLRTYTWAVHKKFNVPIENIRSALYYAEGGNLIPAKFTQSAVDAAIKELTDAYDEITAADPDKILGNVSDNCRRCDYRNMCPFVRVTRQC